MLCGLDQFRNRAYKAQLIGNLSENSNIDKTAQRIWLAEAFQLIFLSSQAVFYILAVNGYISSFGVGISTLVLVPLEALAYRQITVLDGKTTRIFMPIAAIVSFTVIGVLAVLGNPGDYAWTLAGGGFFVQLVRLSTERNDFFIRKRLEAAATSHQ